MFKLTVKLKDSEASYKRDFLIYDKDCRVDQEDEQIKICLSQAEAEFGRQPESIQVKIELEVI